MTPLISLEQLQIGTRLKIVSHFTKYNYGSVSVKKLIDMSKRTTCPNGKTDTEILINRSKNIYFSFNRYMKGESNWVKEVYVLDGLDKRLRRAKQLEEV